MKNVLDTDLVRSSLGSGMKEYLGNAISCDVEDSEVSIHIKSVGVVRRRFCFYVAVQHLTVSSCDDEVHVTEGLARTTVAGRLLRLKQYDGSGSISTWKLGFCFHDRLPVVCIIGCRLCLYEGAKAKRKRHRHRCSFTSHNETIMINPGLPKSTNRKFSAA